MNARLRWWVVDWDWRPLTRMLVWLAIAVQAAKRGDVHFASPGAILEAFVLGGIVTFGLLPWLQLWIVALTVRLYFALDDVTYALSEWIVRPLSGRAPFAVNFLASLTVQLGLVGGGATCWRAAHLGPRVLTLVECAFRGALRVLA